MNEKNYSLKFICEVLGRDTGKDAEIMNLLDLDDLGKLKHTGNEVSRILGSHLCALIYFKHLEYNRLLSLIYNLCFLSKIQMKLIYINLILVFYSFTKIYMLRNLLHIINYIEMYSENLKIILTL